MLQQIEHVIGLGWYHGPLSVFGEELIWLYI